MSLTSTPRVFVVAQARMGSSRLPGKVLRKAGDATLVEHLARRLGRCATVTAAILATTVDPSDDALADAIAGSDLGLVLHLHRGPVDDVLARYVGALASVDAQDDDLCVRVTGDCPLLDPAELDRLVGEFLARSGGPEAVDYLTNQAQATRRIPRGLDVEVMSVAALRRAAREATGSGEREHVTPYLYNTPGRFRVAVSDPPGPDYSHLRLTVDTPEDLALVDGIVRALGPDPSLAQIDAHLAAHPELAALNAGVVQKSTASDMDQRRAKIAGRGLLARADGSATTGFGHITRVGALLDAWTELGGRATLIGAGIVGATRARLEACGIEIVDGGDAELEARLAPGSSFGHAAALAVDGYGFDLARQARWREAVPLLFIDDLATGEQVADVVVNQILDFPVDRYALADHARLLLGPAYVLLRREFRAPPAAPSDDRRVVLSFGGSDPAGLSEPMTRALLAALGRAAPRLVVVLGSGVRDDARARLDALAATEPRVELLHDVREMAEVLDGAQVCVCAAGTTVWEAMARAVPVAAVAVADNQRPILAGLDARAAGLNLGWHGELDPAAAADRIVALLADEPARAALARRGRALIDGRGVYRVLDALLERARG